MEADNKSDPAESANAATKLISDDKVVAIVGPATSGAVQAESQIATENKIQERVELKNEKSDEKVNETEKLNHNGTTQSDDDENLR